MGLFCRFYVLLIFFCSNLWTYFIQDSNLLSHPIFDETQHSTQNSIRLEFAGNLSPKRRYINTNLIYAQPNRIFKLPARINFEIGGVFSLSPPPP
ncbi:hypothetical protein [Helicobacter brantae]|uniref:Uncharacterized protein n=1 Tax=Helicobacter brantae TaxID=375927 RepID=A0A3D8IW61_9HELI|nr:hypothetical protein [Helicobacter brantae]RDU68864.1 hypothetical protein CQA58_07775 [Helicobacter brantae]